MTHLVRFIHPQAGSIARLGLLTDNTVHDIGGTAPSLGAWLRSSQGRVAAAIEELEARLGSAASFPVSEFADTPRDGEPHFLAPVDEQEVWAAGVTYEQSRAARQEEAQDGGDIYARVYAAQRPELFFKAAGWRVVAPGSKVGIRADASWSVPEPELAVLFNPAMEVVGFAAGNDMSSRDIEGENPLYLPQAKVYDRACALGAGILLSAATEWPSAEIRVRIERQGAPAFEGTTHTARIKRTLQELADYLGRSCSFPDGVLLLTGTGTVPPADFTLAVGDVIQIGIEGIGKLSNPVGVS